MAVAISGEWYAPATSSSTIRRAPISLAASAAFLTASTSPLITIWVSVEDQVKKIIADKLDVAKDKVKDEAVLQTDLGADSLDIVELLMHLEDQFDMKIPDEDAEKLKTVGDAIAYINGHIVKE